MAGGRGAQAVGRLTWGGEPFKRKNVVRFDAGNGKACDGDADGFVHRAGDFGVRFQILRPSGVFAGEQVGFDVADAEHNLRPRQISISRDVRQHVEQLFVGAVRNDQKHVAAALVFARRFQRLGRDGTTLVLFTVENMGVPIVENADMVDLVRVQQVLRRSVKGKQHQKKQ